MKVLMIVTCPEVGGTETHVLHLARALLGCGIEVGMATGGGPFHRYFTGRNIKIHKVYGLGRNTPKTSARRIAAIVRRGGYNVVHVHDSESFQMLPFLRRLCPNARLVLTIHGKYISPQQVRRASRFASRVIAVSPAVRNWTIHLGVPRRKVVWVPNAIDTREFSPARNALQYRRRLKLPRNAQIGLYVGRFQVDKWKIAERCILASERIARRHRRFVLVLIGFGAYRNRLQRVARQVNRRLRRTVVTVRFPTPYIARFYRSSTFVIGTGRVAIEAMACGKPVIAAGLSGYQGIVNRTSLPRMVASNFGDHGAKLRVTVPRLTRDITTLLSRPRLANSLGKLGRRAVLRQFSIQRAKERTRKIYRTL